MKIIVSGSNTTSDLSIGTYDLCPQLDCSDYEPACGIAYCVSQLCGNSKAMPYSTKTVV